MVPKHNTALETLTEEQAVCALCRLVKSISTDEQSDKEALKIVEKLHRNEQNSLDEICGCNKSFRFAGLALAIYQAGT